MWIIALIWTFLAPSTSLGPFPGGDGRVTVSKECYDNTFCIESIENEDRLELFVTNLVSWDFTLVVDLELENMVSDKPLPLTRSFPSRGRERVMNLRVAQPGRSWSFRFNLRWVIGAMDAQHDDSYVYGLPFGRSESHVVAQSYNGPATHRGKNAIDFDMEVGTGIRAAREGVVVEVEESYFKGRLDPTLKTQANFVKIRHPDGTIGHYVHLMQNGVRVYEGDRVRRGDLIAYSGDTGYSSGPHLHFEVYTVSKSLQQKTIPVRFRANGRNGIVLREATEYGH